MSIEGTIPELKNIPSNALVVVSKACDVQTCQVRQFREGAISLTGFAISQFLEGAELIVDMTSESSRADVKLLLRLAKGIATLKHFPAIPVEVTRLDLLTLKKWLEHRMAHCEKERDERTEIVHVPGGKSFPKFNADTYIGMKLLLLDLREVLIGEIV